MGCVSCSLTERSPHRSPRTRKKYIEQFLERKLDEEMCTKASDEAKRIPNVPFRKLISELQFVAQCTKPDKAFVVHAVSNFNNNTGEAHWTAA